MISGRVQLTILLEPTKEFDLFADSMEGIKGLARGVYLAKMESQPVRHLVQSTRHISFRKTKQIPRVKDSGPGESENRTYTVVAYSYDSPSAQQKKQTQRLIRRSPCVRLRPGVLLFPHLKAKESLRYLRQDTNHPLYDAKTFVIKMRENGATVRRWSRLRLTEENSEELVGRAIGKMVSREMSSIELRLVKIRDAAATPGVPVKKLKARYTVMARRFRILKANFLAVQRIWHHDTERELRRTYNILLKVKREILAIIDSTESAQLVVSPESH
jgi:hypothetical protein